MTEIDYDDPEIEEKWCADQRSVIVAYVKSQNLEHGSIGEWPAWHLPPCVAIWAIESLSSPGWIGWWAISGDLPPDYISSADIEPPQHPRKAMRAISQRWTAQAHAWSNGQDYNGITIGGPLSHEELAPMLLSRANLLLEWSQDDSMWEEE